MSVEELKEQAGKLFVSDRLALVNAIIKSLPNTAQDEEWQYLVARPHPWRRQIYIKVNYSLSHHKSMLKPKLMIEPSYWLLSGIKLETINGFKLFKFTDELQVRSDELLERSKSGLLTSEEKAELDGISELAQIFTYANSVLAAESKWFPSPYENSSPNEPRTSVNIATPQN